MKTGGNLKITKMGSKVMGVRLKGNRKDPEPESFRVVLPFGDVDITRCSDDSYWVHVCINRPDDGWDPDRKFGKFTDARIDIINKHSTDCDAGDFKNPNMYHLAVRVHPDE